MIRYQEKEQSIEAGSKMTLMLELAHEVLKTAIINIFKDAREKMNILNKHKEYLQRNKPNGYIRNKK